MKKDCLAAHGGCSDCELVQLANSGEDSAFSALVERYMPVLQGRAGRYARLVGVDVEDFIQEGMLALFRAVRRYDENSGVQFNTYAVTCIRNAMTSAIKIHMKSARATADLPFDQLDERGLCQRSLQTPEETLEDRYLERETFGELAQLIQTLLSKFERQVLKLYLNGYTYQQIAMFLGTTTKAVDNALQRVRRKLRPGS